MSLTDQPPTVPSGEGGRGGRRRPRRTPKGRQVDPQALADVQSLLIDRPRRRDLLIEHLHLIQDQYGYISSVHLAALADEMKLAQTEVYEVATFYAHFDVVKEARRRRRRSRCASVIPYPARLPAPSICLLTCRRSLVRGCASCVRPAWAPVTALRFAP